ncbi:hypothetical protein QN219_31165 [Sinorhizobium sp. 7-81]|uniref:hypothetical protein n=1 Tax=Sinorhizobium sp. 8-89 TaxID=3049089 RepID=UPI0024C24045|nr:hypothetical protein [Sinorhizobium sp. 8-89]MDK1494409.1 hypothetical protein [Sinorhizobium sp. 8-89]
MVLPLPPIVHGPITRFSPSVRVTGVLADATVEIFADGGQIGKSVAGSNGTVWVTIFDTPIAGQLITAVQTTTDGSSAPSPQGVPVIDVPNPLPTPVFGSPLTTAMSAVRLSGLVPGASVTISNNGTAVGLAGGSETTAWIPILAGASLDAGTPLVAELVKSPVQYFDAPFSITLTLRRRRASSISTSAREHRSRRRSRSPVRRGPSRPSG